MNFGQLRTMIVLWLVALVTLTGLALLGGCGEKIAIPQPKGVWGLTPYHWDATYEDTDLVQLLTSQNRFYVLTGSALTRRDWSYGYISSAEGLNDALALCADDGDSLIFVWEQGTQTVSWFGARELELRGSTSLPDVQRAVSMITSTAGIDQQPGATTFLYLADPDSGVVHRYAFDEFAGLNSYGILTRSDGDAVRFVHVPGGMARDHEDSLLVCDTDSLRNWVIRFNAEPDPTDTGDPDEFRGRAVLYGDSTCTPPAAADYVLGDAPECGESDWVGGPSDVSGEFDLPQSVAVDGSGRIFVADTRNHRFQAFLYDGSHSITYGDESKMPQPVSLAVVDDHLGGPDDILYAAFVFVITNGRTDVRKYISDEWWERQGEEPPPEQY